MSGNPYTLRAGLLSQAQGILQNQYHQELERIRYLCDRDLLDATTVTWPTKQETTQSTLGVIFVVIVVGILLWLFDMLLGWAIGTLYGVS